MRIDVSASVETRDQQPGPCSLLDECVIGAGNGADYALLAPFHYRNTKAVPGVRQIYRVTHKPSGRVVGVIVYAMPSLMLGIRNQIFGERYKIGGRRAVNAMAAERLNREVELISRVIIHPTFRGIGLGHRLIAATLVLRPAKYVEMSAAMGEVNPFAEKAGMKGVKVPARLMTERVLAALRAVGLTEQQMANPKEILRALGRATPAARAFAEAELREYEERWVKSRTGREANITVEGAARRVAANALSGSVYYLAEVSRLRDQLAPMNIPSPTAAWS